MSARNEYANFSMRKALKKVSNVRLMEYETLQSRASEMHGIFEKTYTNFLIPVSR
jgi:hypothetical protein